jgi:hypothetical protein
VAYVSFHASSGSSGQVLSGMNSPRETFVLSYSPTENCALVHENWTRRSER